MSQPIYAPDAENRSEVPSDQPERVQRGPQTTVFVDGVVRPWHELDRGNGKRGRDATFTDAAVQFCLMIKALPDYVHISAGS